MFPGGWKLEACNFQQQEDGSLSYLQKTGSGSWQQRKMSESHLSEGCILDSSFNGTGTSEKMKQQVLEFDGSTLSGTKAPISWPDLLVASSVGLWCCREIPGAHLAFQLEPLTACLCEHW